MNLYLKQLKNRYIQSDKKCKAMILNEFCKTSGYHRKHAIRLLTNVGAPLVGAQDVAQIERRGRKKLYRPEPLLPPLKQIWLATDQMCGRRLKAAIPIWLPFYEATYGPLSVDIKNQLLAMSEATVDRLLKSVRAYVPKRLCGTKPGSLLKKHIPIKTDQWNEREPGFGRGTYYGHPGCEAGGEGANKGRPYDK